MSRAARCGGWTLTRIAHAPQEVEVAVGTTDVVRRACVLPCDAHGPVIAALLRRQPLLHGDLVLPAIAEVVVVCEAAHRVVQDGANGELAVVTHSLLSPVIVWNAIPLPLDEPLVQVAVVPAHGRLQHSIKLRQLQRAGHEE